MDVLSQPSMLVPVQVYVPEFVYVFPFQLYLSQAEIEDEDTEELFIVRFKVTTLSHPRALVPVQVYIPDVVYVVPFQ